MCQKRYKIGQKFVVGVFLETSIALIFESQSKLVFFHFDLPWRPKKIARRNFIGPGFFTGRDVISVFSFNSLASSSLKPHCSPSGKFSVASHFLALSQLFPHESLTINSQHKPNPCENQLHPFSLSNNRIAQHASICFVQLAFLQLFYLST
jgi:hypothetical protein